MGVGNLHLPAATIQKAEQQKDFTRSVLLSFTLQKCFVKLVDGHKIGQDSIKNGMGPLPTDPQVARAIRYSGLGVVQWVLLEISWITHEHHLSRHIFTYRNH